jgi:hypothetical protein
MLEDRIRQILSQRPHWGPQSIAKATGATPRVVRVTASRKGIPFMDRYEVEAHADQLVLKIEQLEAALRGKTE